MKTVKDILLCCCLTLCVLGLFGCGKKADEGKSMGEVSAEAEKMDVEELRSMALKYKDAIMARQDDIAKKIPLTEMLGEEAKGLKADVENLNKSLSALKERFGVYYDKLKEKGGDASGLQI